MVSVMVTALIVGTDINFWWIWKQNGDDQPKHCGILRSTPFSLSHKPSPKFPFLKILSKLNQWKKSPFLTQLSDLLMYMYRKHIKMIFINQYWISNVHILQKKTEMLPIFIISGVYTITWNDLVNILAEGITTVLQGTI